MIETERLLLRHWRDADLPVFRAHDSDPRVMRYMGPLKTAEQSDATRLRHRGYWEAGRYGFLAVERRADGMVLGFCGLKPGAPDTPIADEAEIGWLFGADHWGQGYAQEAARGVLGWAWATLDVAHVVAITAARNAASRRVMDRLGMVRDPAGDFIHPLFAADDPLNPHVLYSIDRSR